MTPLHSSEAAPRTAPKTLLILGGTGKLARLMRASLQENPAQLPEWRPIWCGRRADDGVDYVLTDPAKDLPQADAVLALWGVIPGAEELSLNTDLALKAIEIAQLCNARQVIHCSSSAVYGPGTRLSEAAPLAPVMTYGTAKIEMERAVLATQQNNADVPRSTVMRLANVIGADSLFGAIERAGVLKLDRFETGQSPLRSYATAGLVWTAVRAIVTAPQTPEVLNIATAAPVAMHALLEAAGHPFEWQDAPDSAIAEVSLDVSALQQLTGSELHVTASEMISEWHMLRKALK